MFKDSTGQWRWHLKADNFKVIASSAEAYHNEADCLAGINKVKESKDAPVTKN
jgi:uncharacterized protein YegP (UPF0339 family)